MIRYPILFYGALILPLSAWAMRPDLFDGIPYVRLESKDDGIVTVAMVEQALATGDTKMINQTIESFTNLAPEMQRVVIEETDLQSIITLLQNYARKKERAVYLLFCAALVSAFGLPLWMIISKEFSSTGLLALAGISGSLHCATIVKAIGNPCRHGTVDGDIWSAVKKLVAASEKIKSGFKRNGNGIAQIV